MGIFWRSLISGFCIIFSFLSPSLGLADEGVNLSPPPANLLKAWNSVVAVGVEPNALASGVVIGQKTIKNKNYLYVITAGHLIDVLNWQEGIPVTNNSLLTKPLIFKNVDIETGGGKLPNVSNFVHEDFPTKLNFAWGILFYTKPADICLLVFEESNLIPDLKPLKFADSDAFSQIGMDSFLIGFPAVEIRPQSHQRVPIERPTLITKRWSKGVFTGFAGHLPDGDIEGSTADSIGGMSGGPILDGNGDIISTLAVSSNIPYDYDLKFGWQSGFYPLNVVKKLVQEQIIRFESQLP